MRPVFSRTEGLAFRSSTNADYVYFASIDGDKVVRFVLEKYNVNEMLYSVNGAYYAKVGEAYKVVWEQVMPTGSDGALPAAQVMANVNTQQKADAQIDMILARKAEGVQQAIVGTFEFTVNFVGRATPLVGTAMAFAQDGAKEGFISLAGDVAFFATLGASKVATVSATAARNLRITAAGAQGVIGVARSGQAYFAIKAGNYVQAGGYMGEALLRFIGVKKGIVDELKAIQALKSAVPSFVQKIIPNPGIQWGKGIQTQGLPWENYLATQLPPGSRLPTGFKTFDFFDRTSRTAISAKTLDTTTAAKIANPKSVYSSLKRDIDAAADFTKSQRLGRVLEAGDIRVRELQLAVPKGTTAEQWEQINQAIQYAKSKGVALEVNAID